MRKLSKNFDRKELIAMIGILRGQLNTVAYVDDEIDEDRLDEIKLTLAATSFDVSDEDLDETGGMPKEWFEKFLEEY